MPNWCERQLMKQADIDELRVRNVPPQRHVIAGRAVDSRDGARMDVVSPIDGRSLTTLADGGAHEIDAAVAAARAAFERGVWSRRAPAARKKTLIAFAELIEAHALEL